MLDSLYKGPPAEKKRPLCHFSLGRLRAFEHNHYAGRSRLSPPAREIGQFEHGYPQADFATGWHFPLRTLPIQEGFCSETGAGGQGRGGGGLAMLLA